MAKPMPDNTVIPVIIGANGTISKWFREYVGNIRSRVQKFSAWHTKAAPNGKCCEGYIVPSMARLMYQLKSVLK